MPMHRGCLRIEQKYEKTTGIQSSNLEDSSGAKSTSSAHFCRDFFSNRSNRAICLPYISFTSFLVTVVHFVARAFDSCISYLVFLVMNM